MIHQLLHDSTTPFFQTRLVLISFYLIESQDFGKNPYMRRFVHDYIRVLYAHNDGPQAVREFVQRYCFNTIQKT